jgi:hypothetical protein
MVLAVLHEGGCQAHDRLRNLFNHNLPYTHQTHVRSLDFGFVFRNAELMVEDLEAIQDEGTENLNH